MKAITSLLLAVSLILPTFAEEETKLGEHMGELSGILKSLRRYEDNDWTGKAKVAQEAQAELLKCFAYFPAMLENVPASAEKSQQIVEYKKLLAENYILLCDLETAFIKQDEDEADDVISELKSIKKKGHTNYIEEN